MERTWTISVLIYGVCAFHVQCYKFPDSIKRCHLKDSNLDDCLKQGIQNAYDVLAKGPINDLNLVGINPVVIDKIVIGAGTAAVNLEQHYSNVKIYGFDTSKVTKVHLDWDKKTLEYETVSPQIQQKANYDINGKVMVLPVYGKGESTITLKDVTMQHIIQFKEQTKGGKKHLMVDTYLLNMEIKGANYDFRNLFDGDQALSKNILTVINENWKEVYDDVKSGIAKAYGEVCKLIANGLFSKMPYNEVFLE